MHRVWQIGGLGMSIDKIDETNDRANSNRHTLSSCDSFILRLPILPIVRSSYCSYDRYDKINYSLLLVGWCAVYAL